MSYFLPCIFFKHVFQLSKPKIVKSAKDKISVKSLAVNQILVSILF